MGNTPSLPLQLPLLTSRPSRKAIYLATNDSNLIPAREIIHLLVTDTQTNTTTPFYIKRSIKLLSVLDFVSRQQGYPAQELEMKIQGTVIGGNATADMVSIVCESSLRRQ